MIQPPTTRIPPPGMSYQHQMELWVYCQRYFTPEEIKANAERWNKTGYPEGLKRFCATSTEVDPPVGAKVFDEWWVSPYTKILTCTPRDASELQVLRYEFPPLHKIAWGLDPYPYGAWRITKRLTIPASGYSEWMTGLEKLREIGERGHWKRYDGSYVHVIRFPLGEVRFEVTSLTRHPNVFIFRAHLWVPNGSKPGLRRTMSGLSFRSDEWESPFKRLVKGLEFVMQREFEGIKPMEVA